MTPFHELPTLRDVKASLLLQTGSPARLQARQQASSETNGLLQDYSLGSTSNNVHVFTVCDPEVLRGPPLLLRVSVACLPPSSGSSHLEAATPLVGYRPFSHTHIVGTTLQQLPSVAACMKETLTLRIQRQTAIPVEWLRRCVCGKDGIPQVASQPPSVNSLMMAVNMPPKRVAVKLLP
jgi:hypothetical protein